MREKVAEMTARQLEVIDLIDILNKIKGKKGKYTPPRYDEIYWEGLRALNKLAMGIIFKKRNQYDRGTTRGD
jgi:hypothetical protein